MTDDTSAIALPPTDLVVIKAMMANRNVRCHETDERSAEGLSSGQPVTGLSFRANDSHVVGYSGFETVMYFDAAGRLLGMGLWE